MMWLNQIMSNFLSLSNKHLIANYYIVLWTCRTFVNRRGRVKNSNGRSQFQQPESSISFFISLILCHAGRALFAAIFFVKPSLSEPSDKWKDISDIRSAACGYFEAWAQGNKMFHWLGHRGNHDIESLYFTRLRKTESLCPQNEFDCQ